MLLGIMLVAAGALIAIYPPLLSLVVAAVLIFLGTVMILMSYHYKKMSRHIDNPFVDFFFRF